MNNQFQLVLRSFKFNKWFVISTIILLTTVITLTSITISVNKKLFFDKLPYNNPDQISILTSTIDTGRGQVSGNSKGLVFTWQHYLKANQEQFAIERVSGGKVNFDSYDKKVRASFISPNYFNFFSNPNLEGRTLNNTNLVDEINEVLVSSDFIQEHNIEYKKNPFILYNKKAYNIVGIIPSSYIDPNKLIGDNIDIWLPLIYSKSQKSDFQGFDSELNFYVRTSNLNELIKNIKVKSLETLKSNNKLDVIEKNKITFNGQSLEEKVLGKSKKSSMLVLTTIFVLSLMILSIVVNNLFSRFMSRTGIYSIHSVLGANLKNIINWITLEVTILVSISLMFSLALSSYLIKAMKSLMKEDVPRILEVNIDPTFIIIVLFVVITIMAIILYLIKLEIHSRNLILRLKHGTKGKLSNNGTFRRLILTIQISVSIICLTISFFVFVESQKTLLEANSYDPGDLSYLFIEIPRDSVKSDQKKVLANAIKLKLLNKQHYETIELIDNLPLGRGVGLYEIKDIHENLLTRSQVNGVEEGFFDLLKIKIHTGRTFIKNEIINNENVVIVNQMFSENILNKDPIDKTILHDGSLYKVIGVVSDIKNPFVDVSGSEYQIYIPYQQYDYVPVMAFLLKPSNKIHEYRDLKKAIEEINPRLNIVESYAVSALHKELFSAYRLRVTITLISIFITFLFMIEGLRNIVSYLLVSNSNDLYIRVVFGAKKEEIIKYILNMFYAYIIVGILFSVAILLTANNYGFFDKNSIEIIKYMVASILLVTVSFFLISIIYINQFLKNKTLFKR